MLSFPLLSFLHTCQPFLLAYLLGLSAWISLSAHPLEVWRAHLPPPGATVVGSPELAPRPVLPRQTLDQASLLGNDAWLWVIRNPLRALVCLCPPL